MIPETPSSDSDGDNYIQFSSSSSLSSFNGNSKYKNTCDIVPSLINHELEKVSPNLTSIISQNDFSDKVKIYDLVSTIRLVDSKMNHITVKANAKRILIVTKIYDIEPVIDTLELIQYILKAYPVIKLFVQDELMKIKEFDLGNVGKLHPELNIKDRIKFWSATSCSYNPNTFDLVITLGGDGTILFTSWLFQELSPPILSFSLGSLGFLTQFDFQEYKEVLKKVLQDGYQCSIRTRFECTVMRSKTSRAKRIYDSNYDAEKVLINELLKCDDSLEVTSNNANEKFSLANTPDLAEELSSDERIKETHYKMLSYSVFNDIVVDRGPNSTMTSIDLFSEHDLLTNIEADGCVFATPSGSTAYSLSAGGSLVHPSIPGVLISPICPHSLSFRPLVVPESIVLRVGVPYDARTSAWCSFDGKNKVELHSGDFLTITTSRFPIAFVKNCTKNNEWFKRLGDTLHWNERKRQKPFNNLDISKFV